MMIRGRGVWVKHGKVKGSLKPKNRPIHSSVSSVSTAHQIPIGLNQATINLICVQAGDCRTPKKQI